MLAYVVQFHANIINIMKDLLAVILSWETCFDMYYYINEHFRIENTKKL